MHPIRSLTVTLQPTLRLSQGHAQGSRLGRGRYQDIWTPQQTSLRFGGETSGKKPGWLKTIGLWVALPLAVLQGSAVSATTSKPSSLPTVIHGGTAVEVSRETTPSAQERLQYQAMELRFKEMEALPLNSPERDNAFWRLNDDWEQLRAKAGEGDKSAQRVLQALSINRMYDELVTPGPQLTQLGDFRLGYFGFAYQLEQYRQGRLSKDQLATEIRWRAILGLAEALPHLEKNPLLQHNSRYFDPTMKLLQSTSHEKVQSFGNALLKTIFNDLSPKQQAQYTQWLASQALNEKPDAQRLSAIKTLGKLQTKKPAMSIWTPIITTAHQRVLNNHPATNPGAQEALKYDIVLLGLLKDPKLWEALSPVLTPTAPPSIQQAAAWAIGTTAPPEGFARLNELIRNPKADPLAQEMAVYSLAEYTNTHSDEVMERLHAYADGEQVAYDHRVRDTVMEAAQAMLEKLDNKPSTEPDYYINKLNTYEEEKRLYKILRDRYVKGFDALATEQKNMVDRSLLPYRHFLPEIITQGGSFTISEGLLIDNPDLKELIGTRTHDGRLYDFLGGVASEQAFTNTSKIEKGTSNVFVHEFFHHIQHFVLDKNGQSQDLETLFKKALSKRHALDSYGQNNPYEYFAQGGEAMDARYKNHDGLYTQLFSSDFDPGHYNTLSELKRTDKALYNFITTLRSQPANG